MKSFLVTLEKDYVVTRWVELPVSIPFLSLDH